MSYPTSWKINPEKQPDLSFDDWHLGFDDSGNKLYPQNPHNQAYMMGWLECFGMDAGYANQLPTINDESYLEGYEQAQFERICHTPSQPDIREIKGLINPAKFADKEILAKHSFSAAVFGRCKCNKCRG